MRPRTPEESLVTKERFLLTLVVVLASTGGTVDKGSKPVTSKEMRHPESRVHGELYGAAGASGHATSEAVGVTSKDKKTSVYVGSDQTNLSSPQGH